MLYFSCHTFILSEPIPGQAAKGIDPRQRFPKDFVLRNAPEIGRPAVQGIVPVISHYEELSRRHAERKINVALTQGMF